jgi:hypothetical protein
MKEMTFSENRDASTQRAVWRKRGDSTVDNEIEN